MRFLSYLLFLTTASHGAPQQFKPIIVKAPRITLPSTTYRYDSATITDKSIDHQQFTHVLDSLQTVPGITVVQSGAMGSQTTIFTRGTNGNHTQMRLDGMRANDPGNANGSFNAAHLNTDGLEKIETIRGAHSTLYGSNALGGVIAATTKAGSGKPSGQLGGEFGSFHTFREKVDLQGEHKWIKVALSATQLNSKRIKIIPKEDRTGNFRQKRDPYHHTSMNSRLDFALPSQVTLTLFNRVMDSTEHYRSQSAPSKGISHFQLHRAVLGHESIPSLWTQSLGVGFLRNTQHNHIKESVSYRTDGRRFQVDWSHILTLHSCYRLKIAAEGEREEFTYRRGPQHNRGKQTTFALRQVHEITPLKEWEISIGLSKDWNSKFKAPVDYRLSSAYTIAATASKVLASIGTGFKNPSLYELYGDSPMFSANPHLKSEQNFAWDVGVEQKITKDIQWNMSYFHNSLKNLIEANSTYTKLINNSRANTYGIESSLTWNITSGLQSIIGYTWLRTKNEETGHALKRRAKHTLSATVLYKNENVFKTGITALYTSRAPDFDPTTYASTHRPSFLTVRAFGEYAMTENLKAHARVENAFNRHYQDPLGYKKPGFAVYAGFKYTCG